MSWGHQGRSDGGFLKGLAGAAALFMVSGVEVGSVAASDRAGRSTVFLAEEGAWQVTVRPSIRVAEVPERRVTVPTPPDEKETNGIIPASAEVVAQQTETTTPLPVTPLPEPPAEVQAPANEFGITIQPKGPRKLTILGRSYDDAYRSIPFSRAEYRANPGYRHEAAMELLFGQMRPTTVVKQMPENAVEETPDTLYSPYLITPSEYWGYPRPAWPYFGAPAGCVWP